VRDWLAWTEPNDPTFLTPQFQQIGGSWVIESAISYATICNAVYSGIHATPIAGERVACGGTAPGGNNDPTSTSPSVGPLSFLKAVKRAGLLRFDAWAHDPYPASPADAPAAAPTPVSGVPTPVTLGNIDLLTNLLTTLYGFEPLWITQYGYETNPPDKANGVAPGKQAQYLTQAFGIARANPRIQLMLWYLLKDEARSNGTQSGLVTTAGKKKPSFVAFRKLGESA
jgi:hypothetical protein